MMKPGECCKGCDNVKEDGIIRNEFRCIFGCGKLAKEQCKKAYDSIKSDKVKSPCFGCPQERVCTVSCEKFELYLQSMHYKERKKNEKKQ